MQQKSDLQENIPSLRIEESDRGSAAGLERASTRGRRHRRTDWRLGGRSVRKWDPTVLVAALGCVGMSILLASILNRFLDRDHQAISMAVLWVGLGLAVSFAFARSRPAGLLKFRGQDLVWGLGLGVILRLAQGVLSGANSAPFPSTGSASVLVIGDSSSVGLMAAGFVAPLLEELFFRGVLLVVVYQLLRRSIGAVAAAATAALVSAGAFVCLHATFVSLTAAESVQLMLVGLVMSLVVILTGRVWPAVLAHLVYNCTFVILAVLGTALA